MKVTMNMRVDEKIMDKIMKDCRETRISPEIYIEGILRNHVNRNKVKPNGKK